MQQKMHNTRKKNRKQQELDKANKNTPVDKTPVKDNRRKPQTLKKEMVPKICIYCHKIFDRVEANKADRKRIVWELCPDCKAMGVQVEEAV